MGKVSPFHGTAVRSFSFLRVEVVANSVQPCWAWMLASPPGAWACAWAGGLSARAEPSLKTAKPAAPLLGKAVLVALEEMEVPRKCGAAVPVAAAADDDDDGA